MSWGNKILITFIVFACGILYLVYRTTQTNYELVEKDYYKSELNYQQQIDGANAANSLSTPVEVSQNNQGIRLQLPAEMKGKTITGDVLFYCAYDKRMDKRFQLKANDDLIQVIAAGQVKPGNYTVKINWADNDRKYYTEKNITVM